MTFPVIWQVFGLAIPAHTVFELLAYGLGFRFYLWHRRRLPAAALPLIEGTFLLVGCLLGALVGAKLLAWAEAPAAFAARPFGVALFFGGKTIVGGLLGGWLGVEAAKSLCGVRHSTGDAFVYPLCFGIALGRVGCFLTGLADHTYGLSSSLPWAIDFGDGVRRHPTQLYEIVALLGLALFLRVIAARRALPNGTLFRLFMAGYLLWRLLVEFLKPRFLLAGQLSPIQAACLIGLALCLPFLLRVFLAPESFDTLETSHG